ncbi:hypothetical protein N9064_00200 [bacterium]|nr:hypothetical protein [bacterium]
MLEKVHLNNVYYYLMPREQRLFKGLSDTSRITNIASYEWYGLSIETAATYGHIYVYSNKKPLKLLAMDERSNIEMLLRDARLQEREDVIDALKDTFMLYDEQPNVVIRHSDPYEDKTVVEFLCKNGYEGYGSDEMVKGLNSSDFFHSEICVCNASDIMVYQDEKIVTEKSRTTIVNLERLGAKKRRRVNENVQNTVVRDLFGSFGNENRAARSLFMEASPVATRRDPFEASPVATRRDPFEASPVATRRDPFEEEFSDDVQSAEEDQEVPRVLFGGEKEENLQETLSVNEDEMLY